MLDAETGKGNFEVIIPENITESGNLKVFVNIPNKPTATVTKAVIINPKKHIDIDFIPEFGYIVEEVPNVLYFEAIGKSGDPVDFKGRLISKDINSQEIIGNIYIYIYLLYRNM